MSEDKTYGTPRGLYFEEFETGAGFVTPARTVTEADIVNYAGFTGDWTSIHTDTEYASQHPVGKRVAHGLLGLSITSGLAIRLGVMEGTILAFREIRDWKFSLPIFIGDTIRARCTVFSKKPVPRLGGGLVTFDIQVLNQDGKIVQSGKWVALIMGKE